jgi:hypothetical protein
MRIELKTTETSIKVAKVGTALLKHFLATNEPICYSDLCELVDFNVCPIKMGYYLGYLSQLCIDNNLPIITALVVNKDKGICSDGFFDCYFSNVKNKKDFWNKYVALIKKNPDWEIFYSELKFFLKSTD